MFTKKEVKKIFDLLTSYSDERKIELINQYNKYDDYHKIMFLQQCITSKMMNKTKIVRAYEIM